MPTRKTRNNSLYGYPNPQANQFPSPIIQNRAPTSADQEEIGVTWVDSSADTAYILTSIGASGSVWTTSPSGGTSATSFTVNPGNLTVTAGDIIVSAGDVTAAGIGTFGSLSTGNATVGGALGVTGNATFGGDVAITGNFTLTGDFDITDTSSISITSTNNAAGAITLLVNGGTAETMVLQSAQGTGAASLNLNSVAGGITLTSNLATADGINLNAIGGGVDVDGALQININSAQAAVNAIRLISSNAAGGIDIDCGTGGITIDSTGVFSIDGAAASNVSVSGAGIDLTLASAAGRVVINGEEATSDAVNILSVAGGVTIGGDSLSVNAGTPGMGIVSNGDIGITSVGATSDILIDSAALLELNSSGGVISIGNDAVAQNINMGTGAAARTITIGNISGATGITLNSGTNGVAINTTGAGDFVVTSADTVLIDSAGVLELNSSAGIISIGNDAVSQNMNIGTAGARTITVGNGTGATSVVVNVGTGALNLGTNATAHATAVGSTTAGSTLALNTPTGVDTVAANGLSVTTAGRGLSLPGGVLVLAGAGSPDTVVTAPAGSLFLRTDPAGATSRAYINTDSATGWTNITCAA